MFVGDGELGKTSLMKKIIGLPFTKEETTHGINKKSWNEIKNSNNEEIKVNLWDFGGQHIQHSLHQFFLTEKVVYILLLNPRNDTNAMYWLEQIDKLGKDSEILIVYNWKNAKDKESHTSKNFYELRKTYPKLREPFLLSCKEGENFDSFKKELIKTILSQKDLLVQYPLNWFDIKKELEKDVTVNKNYIAYNEYDTICKNNEYTNEANKKNLLKQLDKIGSIVFFDKPILNDLQVLNPDWITTGAYSIITSEITNDKKGHLNYKDLNAIFKEEKSLFANKEIKLQYKEKDFQFIIALMTEYDLCVENPFEKNEYLIPCAFEGEKPKQFDVYKENSKQYRFTFESAFEMLIMYRFMARNISKCIKDGYWQSGIVIKDPHSETYALVETNQYSKIINFWISGANIRELWEVLRSHIKDINSKYSLKYKEQVLYFSQRDSKTVFFIL
ncbi:COR domain-containing protein [Flavobacterium sp. YO12]|uniref:COR domain-containing protein n=1 Tax=Flavobacterium sp. YO12 TaxID=1920029 RepID=UPI00210FBBE2|nr:COR domain-containing protein [Flavobacterium sp. YO12]